jgi:hypothetical protein
MNASWKNRLPLALVVGLVLVALIEIAFRQPAQAQRATPPGVRYSVIATEGHNLIVTDNQSDTLYFYTIDKDKEVGTELKLRATVDLTKVGKPVIKPVTIKGE